MVKPISLWEQQWDAESNRRAIESYSGYSRTAHIIRVGMNLGDPIRLDDYQSISIMTVSNRESEMLIVVLDP